VTFPLSSKTHRQHWPVPTRPWVMAQSWHHLLFAHWQVPAEMLQARLPPGLSLDTYEGEAWLGIVPFEMRQIHARHLPAMPGLSAFPELNVRTYVIHDDLPGVWFFSLDADHLPAVWYARQFYHLPYFKARMQILKRGDTVLYRSHRQFAPEGVWRGAYGPTGPVYQARPGTRDYWLTERYYLYAADKRGRLYRGAIHHAPWPLQPAAADIVENSVTALHDLRLPDTAPLLHYAHRLDVQTWSLEPV
jgi:uncharacterized protein